MTIDRLPVDVRRLVFPEVSRPFPVVTTTQTSGSEVICMESGNQGFSEFEVPSGDGHEIPMDTTQSSVEESEEMDYQKSKARSTAINISPLKIAYEKPQICSRVHFKTVTHITATCLIPFILVDTVFVFAAHSRRRRIHHDDVNVIWEPPEHARELTGPANLAALAFSFCHVAIWYWTLRSANLTFWVTMLTTGCLTISGFLLWTAHPHYMPRQSQIVVPFQYVSFFGSVIAWSVAGVAMYYVWQASKYAVVY